VVKLEAEEVEEEDVTRISFSERSVYGRSLRHASGSGQPADTKPPQQLAADHINMDDKIALAENMMSSFKGNPLLLSIPPSTGNMRPSETSGSGSLEGPSGMGLLHAVANSPAQFSPPEQERLVAAAAYYNSRGGSHPERQTPGLNPFWGMRSPGGPPHPHHQQYMRSRELMQDYAAVQAAVAAAAAAQAAHCRRDLGWGAGSSVDQPDRTSGGPRGIDTSVRQSSVIVRADKQNPAARTDIESEAESYHQQRCDDEEERRQLNSHRNRRITADMAASHPFSQPLPYQHAADSSKHQQELASGNNNFMLNLSPKEREIRKSWLNLQSVRMNNLVQQTAATDRGLGPASADRIKLEDGGGPAGLHQRPVGPLRYPNSAPYLGPSQQHSAPAFPGLKASSSYHGAKSGGMPYSGVKPYHRYDERAHQRQIKEERKSKMAERLAKVRKCWILVIFISGPLTYDSCNI
jgi:hypothetical protein